MANTIRLTMAQALVRWLTAQRMEQTDDEETLPAFAGVWAIFGHGNVAGLGEALYAAREQLPTYRAHNEQGMAHIALAYAKQKQRRQIMAATTSIGPGATNLATAAALAHVNRLPILLLPGDVFASRRPDPVLQQVESFADGLVTANDCLRPLSRYFDRITRPEQLLKCLPKAMSVLTDAADCGPVTIALCQDTQAQAWDYPQSFFAPRVWHMRRLAPDKAELQRAARVLAKAKRPLIIAGGGVRYSGAAAALKVFAEHGGIPVACTQAGKSTLVAGYKHDVGPIGVTGSSAANKLAAEADVVLAVGSRLQDFTTGSNGLIRGQVIALNAQSHDLAKHNAMPLQADAKVGLLALGTALIGLATSVKYQEEVAALRAEWDRATQAVCKAPAEGKSKDRLPADSEVIGAVNRACPDHTIVIGAAGSMPGELHKLWRVGCVDGYHMEYGYSCMGYEIAAAIGVYMAEPGRPNVVFAGDGSYLMLNAELATAVMMGASTTIIVTDNRGYGCINRLQVATGGVPFNNLFADCNYKTTPRIDYVAHAAAMGARAVKAGSIAELEALTTNAVARDGVDVIVIDTDPDPATAAGGTWWEVAVPEVSARAEVVRAHAQYLAGKKRQDR